jgi:L-xylulokinase
MAKDVLIGLDLGTTVLKAAAMESPGGRLLAGDQVRLPVRAGADGAREQQPIALVRAVGRLAERLRERLGRQAWARVAGVGLAAQGASGMLADDATGRARSPMQLWSDLRPLGLLPRIAARAPRGYWRRLAYLKGPGRGLARIEWLRSRHGWPEGTMYVGAGEFLFFHLTGCWRQDAGNAVQMGCYDARRQSLATKPLELVGLSLEAVAPLRQGHRTAMLSSRGAALMRLPEHLPTAGPYMDHEAGYLAVTGLGRRVMQCSLGTAWVANYLSSGGPPLPGAMSLVLPSPLGGGRLVIRVMLAGNASWDWGAATLVGASPRAMERAQRELADRLLPPEGLTALPWLTMPNPLAAGCAGAGGFLGISTTTSRTDLLAALAAGMCYEMARLVQPVLKLRRADCVVLSGGASHVASIRALLAGLLAPAPVAHLADDFAGCRGAVWAFDHRVVPRHASPVPLPDAGQRRAIRRQYEQYVRLCRVLGRGLGHDGGLYLRSGGQGR